MRHVLIIVAFVAAFTLPQAVSAERIGRVYEVQPDSFQAVSTIGRRLRSSDPIYRDARVYTKLYGTLQIRLDDGSDLMLSPNSSIILDDYVYAEPGGEGSFAFRLAQGAARVVSGRMAKESYRADTAVAIIGVRGTRYWLDVDEPGILKIWVDEGSVVARPVATDREFVFEAPIYAECTPTACERTDPPPKPIKFPLDPRQK